MKPIRFFWLLIALVLTSQLALTQSRPQELIGKFEGGESISGASAASSLQLNRVMYTRR